MTAESVDESTINDLHKDGWVMGWFDYSHLSDDLQTVACRFRELAVFICAACQPGPERSVALRKLLEAKDAAVRARLKPGG
jgi:hypothetical protein